MTHNFNVHIAISFGVDEAIMLGNLHFWIKKNQANRKHFYDGYYWTYNSVSAFAELFPYWSAKQITRILKSLEDKQAILTGNYNKVSYDRTKWYAVNSEIFSLLDGSTDKENAITQTGNSILPKGNIHLPKQSNGYYQTGKPIPDINSDSYTDNNTDTNSNKINSITKSNDFDAKKELALISKQPIQEKEKVAPKRKRVTYKDFIDTWRGLENDQKFNFEINGPKNVGQFRNLQKAIENDLVRKYTEFDYDKELNAFQLILELAYNYFTEMYSNGITSVLLFEPVYVYSHYSKIKTYKPAVKDKNNRIDWDQVQNNLNKKYGN